MTTSRRKPAETRLRVVNLYSPEDARGVRIAPVKTFLKSLLPAISVRVRPSITRGMLGERLERLATAFAAARVKDPSKHVQTFEPMYGEVDYEMRAISGRAVVGGVVYDGRKVESVCLDLLRDENSLKECSVVFTHRLLSTFSEDDLRHHLRTIVCGFPSLISIPGIVEAPAKPREYYIMKQQLESAAAGELERARLKSMFKERFIDYDDPSAIEVLKGLALQAVVFHLTLRPFCDDPKCRLYNAHWQEELIRTQINSGKLCAVHASIVKRLGADPRLAW